MRSLANDFRELLGINRNMSYSNFSFNTIFSTYNHVDLQLRSSVLTGAVYEHQDSIIIVNSQNNSVNAEIYIGNDKVNSFFQDTSEFFIDCKLDSLVFNSFDTSNVNDMSSMFKKLTIDSLDLSCFNTSKVNDMSSMFEGCNINHLNLSSFDTRHGTKMNYMFKDCKIDNITFGDNMVNRGYINNMFENATINNREGSSIFTTWRID